MLVSLFTDASWCPDTNAAGWGAWAKCDNAMTTAGGPIGKPCPTSTIAEARAVYMGLLMCAKHLNMADIDRILIQLDNYAVVSWIHAKSGGRRLEKATLNAKKKSTIAIEFIEAIKAFEKEHSVIVMGKHIKGHRPNQEGAGHWVNNRCDQLARNGLERARRLYHESQGDPTEPDQGGREVS